MGLTNFLLIFLPGGFCYGIFTRPGGPAGFWVGFRAVSKDVKLICMRFVFSAFRRSHPQE